MWPDPTQRKGLAMQDYLSNPWIADTPPLHITAVSIDTQWSRFSVHLFSKIIAAVVNNLTLQISAVTHSINTPCLAFPARVQKTQPQQPDKRIPHQPEHTGSPEWGAPSKRLVPNGIRHRGVPLYHNWVLWQYKDDIFSNIADFQSCSSGCQ